MYRAVGGKKFCCRISGYRRTRVFEFPGIAFNTDGEVPHHPLYSSPSVHACLASNLKGYFVNSTPLDHYEISPSLRHEVGDISKEIESQQKDRTPIYLVIEESNQLTPIEMSSGECSISDEIVVRDGKKIPILVGGREGESFLTAWHTIDGVWPEVPNNELSVNMILACVRAGQRTPDPIRKYLDQSGLVTDDGRFVWTRRPTASARLSVSTLMDTIAYGDRASDIRRAINAIDQDIGSPHIALLVNALYRDEVNDDAYQRLHFLQLWQSLIEAGPRWLGYQGDIKNDKVVVEGSKTLAELRDYRDDIAHWWTSVIDENYLADLQRTINELIRRKYF